MSRARQDCERCQGLPRGLAVWFARGSGPWGSAECHRWGREAREGAQELTGGPPPKGTSVPLSSNSRFKNCHCTSISEELNCEVASELGLLPVTTLNEKGGRGSITTPFEWTMVVRPAHTRDDGAWGGGVLRSGGNKSIEKNAAKLRGKKLRYHRSNRSTKGTERSNLEQGHIRWATQKNAENCDKLREIAQNCGKLRNCAKLRKIAGFNPPPPPLDGGGNGVQTMAAVMAGGSCRPRSHES